jgi:hypothetical protein
VSEVQARRPAASAREAVALFVSLPALSAMRSAVAGVEAAAAAVRLSAVGALPASEVQPHLLSLQSLDAAALDRVIDSVFEPCYRDTAPFATN